MNEDRAKGTAKNIAGKVESAAGDLTRDAKTRASGDLRQAEGAAQHLVGQATEAVGEFADDASAAIAQAYEAGARYYGAGNRAVERRIEDNTVLALLAAGAAGYMIAWLIHGRR